MSYGIQIFGPIWDISGISNALRHTAIALYDAGVPVNLIHATGWSGINAALRPSVKAKLDEMTKMPIPQDHVFVNYLPPTKITHLRNDSMANICYTLYETDRCPSVWPMIVAQHDIDEVWVPTQFNMETFITGGMPADKLHCVPMGVDTAIYNPGVEPVKLKGQKSFKFLTIMDVKDCKGFDILLDAYYQEFNSSDDVCLIFKGYSGALDQAHQNNIKNIIKGFKDKNKSTATVIFIGGNIDTSLMPGLYKNADCFILPTKGEGFCLPAIYSMACGVPALMTRATGYLDYMNDTNGVFLECEKKPITNIKWLIREPYQQGHFWWETTVEETRKKMRWAYEHRADLQTLGQKAATDVKKFSWDNTATAIVDNILRIANETA